MKRGERLQEGKGRARRTDWLRGDRTSFALFPLFFFSASESAPEKASRTPLYSGSLLALFRPLLTLSRRLTRLGSRARSRRATNADFRPTRKTHPQKNWRAPRSCLARSRTARRVPWTCRPSTVWTPTSASALLARSAAPSRTLPSSPSTSSRPVSRSDALSVAQSPLACARTPLTRGCLASRPHRRPSPPPLAPRP